MAGISRGGHWYSNMKAEGHATQLNGDIINSIINVHSTEDRERVENQLLRSLSFEEMNVRHETVQRASDKTLSWIFDASESSVSAIDERSRPPDPDSDDTFHWSGLAQWLREDSSIYWIRGKAGSGKSTMMAHLIDAPQTKDNLRYWSGDRKLNIISFFFWKAGTDLQKSTEGLLRSLLHQICTTSPESKLAVLNFVGAQSRRWTDRRLMDATAQATSATDQYFCLFLDGLDEYCGDPEYLLDLLTDLTHPNNVKACVSSRSEAAFDARFSKCRQLRLEDLNRDDICKFVEKKLEPYQIQHKDELITQVVNRASGVFLWAALVTQSLVQGAQNYDTSQMLFDRLQDVPDELDDLFAAMIKRLDKRYKEWFGFYMNLMQLQRKYGASGLLFNSIAYIAAARINGSLESYDAFSRACKTIEAPISFRSAGLLEVPRDIEFRTSELREEWTDARYKFGVPQLLDPNQAGFNTNNWSANDVVIERKQLGPRVEFPEVLYYENLRLSWIHRSAYDFVLSSHEHSWLKWEENDSSVLESMLTGMLRYLAIAPSFWVFVTEEYEFSTDQRLSTLLNTTSLIYSDYPGLAFTFLDRIYEVVAPMQPEEFKFCDSLIEALHHASFALPGASVFWFKIFRTIRDVSNSGRCRMLVDYLKTRFDRWTHNSIGNHLINPLDGAALLHLWEPSPSAVATLGRDYLVFLEDVVRALLQRMQHSTSTKKSMVRMRRMFLADADKFDDWCSFGPLGNELRSVSCCWPDHADTPTQSRVHALAIFMLVALFRNFIAEAQHIPERSKKVTSSLRNIVDFFKPAWNVQLSFDSSSLNGVWLPSRLSIELSYELWEALFQRAGFQAEIDQGFWQNPPLRVLCLPLFGQDMPQLSQLAFWEVHDLDEEVYRNLEEIDDQSSDFEIEDTHSIATSSEIFADDLNCSAYIDCDASAATKNLLMELLVSGSLEKTSFETGYEPKLTVDQKEQLESALASLKRDVSENEQGLSEPKQRSALACIEKEILTLRKWTLPPNE